MRPSALAIACGVLAASTSAAAADTLPRGVGPEFASFYKDTSSFTCISNPSVSIPFRKVNDDYCDCPDGSDEPGTSACSHLSDHSVPQPRIAASDANTSLALPGFYCKNKGHRPSYIPFTWVNDGHCDATLCCDGSEEWSGLAKCADQCGEIGKAWRKQDEVRQRARSEANKQRRELVANAARLRLEVEDRIKTLGAEIEGAELRVAQLEQELVDVERRERTKVVRTGGKGDKTAILIELARARTRELREALERVRQDRDANRMYREELEQMLATFKEEYNPNFNDEGVKRAVRAWEDYAAKGKSGNLDAAVEMDLDQVLKADEANGIDWEEWKTDSEDEIDLLYQFEEYLPTSLRGWVDSKLRDLRTWLIESGVVPGPSGATEESEAVKEARNRLQTAKNDMKTNIDDRQGHYNDLEKDYGPDDVFRAMKDRCVETDSGEYTYEVCFLGKTTQKPKKGGSHTGMGNYDRIERIVVDEDLPPDGRGLGSGERIALKYENGQHCWNGPNRATTVILACAEKDEIWKVMEEEKCIYRMEVGTPAVCIEESSEGTRKGKDEL